MTRENLLQLIRAESLVPGTIYEIQQATQQHIKISLVATSRSSVGSAPAIRTQIGAAFHQESYSIENDKLTCIDNLSCVIRFQMGHWEFIQNTGHQPEGFQQVLTQASSIRINYAKTYDKVIGHSISLDETYSRSPLCLSAGTSVGLSYALIEVYKTIISNGQLARVTANHNELNIPGSNIWVNVSCARIV